MKGLNKIPSQEDLEKAYAKFQTALVFSSHTIQEDRLAFYSQWVRFDPRLGEQWVSYVSKQWKSISPVKLNSKILKQPWPAVSGVLLETVLLFEISDSEKTMFQHWKSCALSHVKPAQGELLFIGLRKFGGKLAKEDALFAFDFYRKWGYLGREFLINKASEKIKHRTFLPKKFRRHLLETLFAQNSRLRTEDYQRALKNLVSARQAQRDILEYVSEKKKVRARGNTKGRFYSSD